MTSIVIAPARVTALPQVQRMFARAVTTHFAYFPQDIQQRVISEHSVYRLLRATLDPRRIILLARTKGQIIGYAIGASPPVGPAQLFWLYVDPEFRGENTGLSLLSRMLRILALKGAREVSIATHTHRSYYERQGFKFLRKTTVDGVSMDVMVFALPQRGTS